MAPRHAHPFFKAGVPLLGLTIGGFMGLQFFLQGRLDVQNAQRKELDLRALDAQRKELDLRAPVNKQRAKKFNLEEELARLKGEVDLEHYENVPVPRPKELAEEEE